MGWPRLSRDPSLARMESIPLPDGLEALSVKERDVLRLIARGHDAKSAARELNLSVHTINERLRAARRKLDVTSSREAARLLLKSEAHTPQLLVPKQMGDANRPMVLDPASIVEPGRHRAALLIGGLLIMAFFALAISLALTASLSEPAPPQEAQALNGLDGLDALDAEDDDSLIARLAPIDPGPENAARQWLALVDRSDWQASYEAAGTSFRTPNTVAGWQAASQAARVPLGVVVKREAIATELVAAPPNGFTVVKFLTKFEGGALGVEHVTLEREADGLKVVGYFIE